MIDQAADLELPALGRNVGLLAQVEHWPAIGQMLAGRQAIGLDPPFPAGEKLVFARPSAAWSA